MGRSLVTFTLNESGEASAVIEHDFDGTVEEWLEMLRGAPGCQWRFEDDDPDDAIGADGDIWVNKTTKALHQRVDGAYVYRIQITSAETPSEPPADVPESDDDTVVPDDVQFIYSAAGDDFRLGEAQGNDYRVLRNNVAIPLPFVASALLYYQAPGAQQRDVYARTYAEEWFIWTGPNTGYNSSGFTQIAGDPHPVDESGRDPTDPVSIQANGKKVYRFAAAHKDGQYVIANFDANNTGGHDTAKIGEALDANGKTAADVSIAYPGTPAARLTVAGTTFQIDFTTIDVADSAVAPTRVYSTFGSSTTDNVATLTVPSAIPAGQTNLCAWVGVEIKSGGTAADIAGVTLGGQDMQRFTPANYLAVTNKLRTAWFYLVDPPTGAQNAVVTFDYTSGKTSLSVAAGVICTNNTDQSNPAGANVGFYSDLSNTVNLAVTSLHDNSLLMAQALIWSPNTNPINPGAGVDEAIDIDISTGADSGAFASWFASKPAVTAGAQTLGGTLTSGQDVKNCTVIEVRGASAGSDLFDIGPYLSTNVAGGGPDIATDITPSDWPVQEGTGLTDPTPTVGDYWGGVLTSHGSNSDLNRSWNDDELAGFATAASAFRMFGYARIPAYSAFSSDSQNIDLIERAMDAGLRVLLSPFTATKYDGINPTATFPAYSNTSLVNTYKARLADIAAVAQSLGWPTDMFALEMWNEPLYPLGQDNAMLVYQAFIDAIRAVNEDIWLAAMGNGREGNSYEPYYAGWLRSGPLNDPRSGEHRISYGHHHYLPMNFTHQGTGYKEGNPAVEVPAGSVHYPQAGYGIAQIRAQLTDFRNWANANGVQIHIGEIGATTKAPSLAERVAYVGDVFQVCRELAIPAFIWSDDNHNDAVIGNGWFGIMQGAANNASFRPEWSALIAQPGQQ